MTPNPLGHDERLPLYQRLRDEIVAKIAVGEWLPGEAIPTEAELTRSYGVAVGTVRKAVDTLVSEGLLLRAQGRGTFVRRPNFDGSLFRFFRQVNASGESQVPQSRILTRTQQAPPAHVRQALNLAEGHSSIRLERLRLIEGQPLLHEQIWLPEAKFSTLLEIDLSDFGTLLYPFYEEHCGMRVASARETLTVTSADEALAGALGLAVDSPVVMVERVALGYDRQPLEYRLSRGAAETFRYQVEIS